MLENLQEKSQENGPPAETWQDRKNKRTRQKNERGDRKRESNDGPEIPDRRNKLKAQAFVQGNKLPNFWGWVYIFMSLNLRPSIDRFCWIFCGDQKEEKKGCAVVSA